jgi:hypothetical protein
MANADAQTGYKSKVFRGGDKVEHVQTFDLPEPSVTLIDAPELEQDNNSVPKLGGSTNYGEFTITCVQDKLSTVQNAMMQTFLTGDRTPEAWTALDCDPDSGDTDFTYAFSGFISGAKPGPFETGAAKLIVYKITLSTGINRTP